MIQISASRISSSCKLLYINKPGILTLDENPLNFIYSQEISEILKIFNLENEEIIIKTKGSGIISKRSWSRLASAKLVLTSNPKRKLPKKPECYGVRAKRQKSYRRFLLDVLLVVV